VNLLYSLDFELFHGLGFMFKTLSSGSHICRNRKIPSFFYDRKLAWFYPVKRSKVLKNGSSHSLTFNNGRISFLTTYPPSGLGAVDRFF
jgi:hypothetical protein